MELDPTESGVGYGGLPNADGVVQLDSCCMHGPKKRAGSVAAIEGVRTPARVAHAVMEHTDHHLLVSAGAQSFARNMGFTVEDDLNTELSRKRWLDWKRRIDPRHYLDPKKRAEAGLEAGVQMVREGLIDEEHFWGTINCDGVGPTGDVCGVTTTSGLAWKIPGRVGDSPILGAGLYVDNEVGAAGSTGRGEANLYGLCSFFVVEEMRRSASPKDAGMAALKRVQANTVEKRLLNSRGLPSFGLSFYVTNKNGDFAGRFDVCDRALEICRLHGERRRVAAARAAFRGKLDGRIRRLLEGPAGHGVTPKAGPPAVGPKPHGRSVIGAGLRCRRDVVAGNAQRAPYAFPLQLVHDVLTEIFRVVVEGEVENDSIARRTLLFLAWLGPGGRGHSENQNGDGSVAPAHFPRLGLFRDIVKPESNLRR